MQLIFIHGSGGCKESWKFQTEYFQGSEAINLPGHPDGELCPTIEAYAEWVHGYVQEKGYSDVVMVGHSLGGGIALQYALDYPSDIKGIVLMGSGARLRVHPMFLEGLEKAIQDPEGAEMPLDQTYDLINPELAEVLKKRSAENGLVSTLNDLKACDRFDVMERLGEIKVPILAVAGDQDVMTPPKYSQFLADKVPGTKAVIIPGGTHMAYAEKPDEANQAIEEFIKGI